MFFDYFSSLTLVLVVKINGGVINSNEYSVAAMEDKDAMQFYFEQKTKCLEHCDPKMFDLILLPGFISAIKVINLLIDIIPVKKRHCTSREESNANNLAIVYLENQIRNKIIIYYCRCHQHVQKCASILQLQSNQRANFVCFFDNIIHKFKQTCIKLNEKDLADPQNTKKLLKISHFFLDLYLRNFEIFPGSFYKTDAKAMQKVYSFTIGMTSDVYTSEAG